MDTKPFSATYPHSFWSMPVGSEFFAADIAGLTTSPKLLGMRVTRTGSETWDLDTFRVHSDGPPEKVVRVDRYAVTATGSYFIRPRDRGVPPDPAGGVPGSGHYPGTLPVELGALLTDPCSKATVRTGASVQWHDERARIAWTCAAVMCAACSEGIIASVIH